MEITINEKEKTIKLHDNIKLKELYEFLEKYNINIDEWSIVATETIYSYPYTTPSVPITPYYPPWNPSYPITYC